MAGVIGVATRKDVTLTAATAKTIIQVTAAANHPIKIKEWGVFFEGISVTAEPVDVRLLRQTTAGTMSSLTPQERTAHGITIQTAAQHTATVEPTAGGVMNELQVHPQSGYQEKFSFGDEIIVPAGGRIGIECTAAAGVDVTGLLVFEE